MLKLASEKFESGLLNAELDVYQDEAGQIWFHGATLCEIFKRGNASVTIQRIVDEEWRQKFPVTHGKDAWYVMEPGLYQLLHGSKHPAARRFQRWVFSEVLPSIRKTGEYRLPEEELQRIAQSKLSSKTVEHWEGVRSYGVAVRQVLNSISDLEEWRDRFPDHPDAATKLNATIDRAIARLQELTQLTTAPDEPDYGIVSATAYQIKAKTPRLASLTDSQYVGLVKWIDLRLKPESNNSMKLGDDDSISTVSLWQNYLQYIAGRGIDKVPDRHTFAHCLTDYCNAIGWSTKYNQSHNTIAGINYIDPYQLG